MSETGLTNDERRCLQLWFRQAIAAVEREEVTKQLFKRDRESAAAAAGHRSAVAKRRPRRSKDPVHSHEVLV